MAYATLGELKRYLGIYEETNDKDDALLQAAITRATEEIDKRTYRTFEWLDSAGVQTPTTRTFDADCDVDGAILTLGADLAAAPTEIVNGDGTTLDPTDTRMFSRMGPPYYAIEMLPRSEKAWDYDDYPEDAISVTGLWCYDTTVPEPITEACLLIAEYEYRRRENGAELDRAVFVGDAVLGAVSVPERAMGILRLYVREEIL